MKKSFIVLLISLGLGACEHSAKPSELAKPEMVSEEYSKSIEESLIGNWERTNNGAEERTFEFWKATKNGVSGIGFTLVDEDTVFKEILEIVELEGNRYYDVRGVNPEPTLFKLIEVSDSHFVCVNDSNEFPKRIEYQFANDSMTAIISAEEQKVVFQFIRIE